jgi:hypothetical protein
MYNLYSVGDRREPCGIPAIIHLGVDIPPITATLNLLSVRNELISLITLVDNSYLDNLYSKP